MCIRDRKNATAKFDETIELHLRTGCDGRHAEQQIRGAVVLPQDVYKRQLENEAYAENMKNLNFISEKVLDIRSQVDNLLDFSIAGSQRPIAVSYTHLDVYKRQ